jgi:hypothetical protein
VGEELSLTPAEGLRVVWDRTALAALADPGDEPNPGWRLEGSLEPAFTALRVVSGATADGSLLVLCAARPQGAAHHDEESVAAIVADPEGDLSPISEALVSTEYAPDGAIRRLGLELYREGDDYPLRGAGDATKATWSEADGERRDSAQLNFRLDGSEGAALYEIVQRI